MKTRTLVVLAVVAFVLTMVSAAHAQTPARMPSFTEPSVETEHDKLVPPPQIERIVSILTRNWTLTCYRSIRNCGNLAKKMEKVFLTKDPSYVFGRTNAVIEGNGFSVDCRLSFKDCESAAKKLRSIAKPAMHPKT